MANRKCSLCEYYYTDEEGHDPDACVGRLKSRVRHYTLCLREAEYNLEVAKTVVKLQAGKEEV